MRISLAAVRTGVALEQCRAAACWEQSLFVGTRKQHRSVGTRTHTPAGQAPCFSKRSFRAKRSVAHSVTGILTSERREQGRDAPPRAPVCVPHALLSPVLGPAQTNPSGSSSREGDQVDLHTCRKHYQLHRAFQHWRRRRAASQAEEKGHDSRATPHQFISQSEDPASPINSDT